MLPRKVCLLSISLLLLTVFSPAWCSAQIVRNGTIDDGLNWWFEFGSAEIQLSDDGYQGGTAINVTNRDAFWNGVGQSLQGQLVPGTDYHVQAWVKLPPEQSGTMAVTLYQNDDRDERTLRIGEAIVGPDQWTQIQAAFTYDPHGDVNWLYLTFGTSETDGGNYDFLIDSISIVENQWREAADERIEQIRKRNATVNFARSNGAPVEGLSVQAVQISQAFPFGSALRDNFTNDPVYAEFFKTHFKWATIEWMSQWYATEQSQGFEDYSLVDASLEFCEQNGIDLKGHALFWGQESTRPDWLSDLSASALQQAMENRITSAVTRYGSRLFGWDVNNEMLHNDFFKNNLGESIRTWMFTRARELNPDIKLFLNEYDLSVSEARATRYRALADSLISGGADVGGVGFQSHFNGRMSPKGLEIGMEPFSDSGLGIWFTEFDTTHPDPEQRAASLEDFYRYAFSRPESQGIIMWGFWAGSHWRGPDASLVDLDWSINAAGQKYFELMDEWTTEVEGSSSADGSFEFRGFHGSYLVTTTDASGIVNHHLINIDEGVGDLQIPLTTNSAHESLSIYGTAGDDLLEFDLAQPDRVEINGSIVNFGLAIALDDICFAGLGGTDRLKVTVAEDAQDLLVNDRRMVVRGQGLTVRFEEIANIEVVAASLDSRVTVVDSGGDDVFESFPEVSTITSSDSEVSVVGFGRVFAYSNYGNDIARIFDSPFQDRFVSNLNFVNVRRGQSVRHATGFSENIVNSSAGTDLFNVLLPNGIKSVDVSPESLAIFMEDSQKQFQFNGFPYVKLFGDDGNSDTVNVVGGDVAETLSVSTKRALYYGVGFRYEFTANIRSFASLNDSPGGDRLIFRDTASNETLSVTGDTGAISGGGYNVSFQYLNSVIAYSQMGGTDSATVDNPTATVRLIGDWIAND